MKPATNPAFSRSVTPSEALLVNAAAASPEIAANAWADWKTVRNDSPVSNLERILFPTVAWNLRATADQNELVDAIQSRRKVTATNLVAVSRLSKVLEILAAEGVTPLVLKGGALLSSACYDDIGARRMADFDLLVVSDQADSVLSSLERHGQLRFGREEFSLATIRSVMHAAALQGPLGELDVHWTLLHHSREARADQEVVTTAETATLGGLTIRTPAPSQLAFHLLAHGRLPDLRWLVDCSHLLRRVEVDPLQVAMLAQERRYLKIVTHNVEQLASVLPSDANQAMVEAVRTLRPRKGDQLHMEFTDAVGAGQRARALTHFARMQIRSQRPAEHVTFLRQLARFATGAPSTGEAARRLFQYAALGRTRADAAS